ncbi:MAG: peptide-methionine (R)-S-oxide reductase MsrB [Mesonia sp.]|uniref:peptide-methionine (R)-S-oxide reductase MsrB n=1 Tax=Mesonia sp. TaxID=1960830 RepID=UPI003F95BC19
MKNIFLFIACTSLLFSCDSNAQKKSKAEQFPVQKTEAQWKKELSAEQFNVLRKAGTERPFSSPLNDIKEAGTFLCAACENPLYVTKNKFKSGTGWPSFDQPIDGGVFFSTDNKLGYTRNEVLCANCGGHIGHVFDDGPKETTGKRFCMNGDAMTFVPTKK